MRAMPANSVDLIYADPPFNTGQTWENKSGKFSDKWESRDNYLNYMGARLKACRHVLKPAGSIYLHCDPAMSHYLKVLMDTIFYLNHIFFKQIVWKRHSSNNSGIFGEVTDIILLYGGSPLNSDPTNRVKLDADYIERHYKRKDEFGRWATMPLITSGKTNGESGQPWLGCDPNDYNGHWSPPKTGKLAEFIEETVAPGYAEVKGVLNRLDFLNEKGLVLKGSRKVPRVKAYLLEGHSVPLSNMWTDITRVSNWADEYERYPTQKPVKLLRRIINASSNKGDVVLDPFCGSGTACVAAKQLERRYIGIDQSTEAIKVSKRRLRKVKRPLF